MSIDGPEGTRTARRLRPYPPGLKVAVSAFILFHWFCVITWVMPKPSAIKTYLLSIRVPIPGPSRQLVSGYLFNTAQYQDWAMFAPDPLQVNRRLQATVSFRDGSQRPYLFPQLSQMGAWEAWVEKRHRRYQQQVIDDPTVAFREDLARFIAGKMATDRNNPPVRVVIEKAESPIPRHDRPERMGAGRVDYTRILRREAVYTATPLLDYQVTSEDLSR